MKIEYNEQSRIFQLSCSEMAYAFAIADSNEELVPDRLVNIHWGSPVGSMSDYDHLLKNPIEVNGNVTSLCKISEYSFGDAFDYSPPCLRVRFADGSETLRLRYSSHVIENDTLKVTVRDEFYPIEVELIYKTWGDLPLIGRSAVIRNTGKEKITLLSAKSASLNLPQGKEYRFTHYSGSQLAEYQKSHVNLTQSKVQLETNRLTNAAIHHVPFFALDENGNSTETMGGVYFGVLGWSGDFQITAETQFEIRYRNVRVTAGISDFTAQYPLEAGESFETPMLTCGYSDKGFGHMSEILYDWQFDYTLPRGEKSDKARGVRPIIYNTWYPYEFGIDEQKLIDFIPKAKYIGAELYVIDDGWMPGRTSDKAGLGDWTVDKNRFPRGLKYISDAVHKAGMKFGLWVEPEMVNPDSDLYRAHPDWVLGEPNRKSTLMRNQLILDMSRDEIRDWAIDWLEKLIIENDIDYLKWDMNREASEIGLYNIERGVAIKYVKNILYIWEHLNKRFPDILLENCAAGGGRADFGMAPFADRVNRSDNADPVDLMILHEGYSTLFVPKLAGGAGNIAPAISPYNSRSYPLDFRINWGMTGSMSVGINLLKCSDEELEVLKDAIARFKELRPALQDSYVYRIASAYEHPYCIFEYTKRDRSEFTVFAFGHGMHLWDRQMPKFTMRGLIPDAVYYCKEKDLKMTGAALMSIGVDIFLSGDYSSQVFTWKKI